jgi:hypothetical protein
MVPDRLVLRETYDKVVTLSYFPVFVWHIAERKNDKMLTVVFSSAPRRAKRRNGTNLWWLIWYAFVRLVGASGNTTRRKTARCRTVVLSSCRYQQHIKAPNGALSHCRLVSSAARQTARFRAARCCDVALSLSL